MSAEPEGAPVGDIAVPVAVHDDSKADAVRRVLPTPFLPATSGLEMHGPCATLSLHQLQPTASLALHRFHFRLALVPLPCPSARSQAQGLIY